MNVSPALKDHAAQWKARQTDRPSVGSHWEKTSQERLRISSHLRCARSLYSREGCGQQGPEKSGCRLKTRREGIWFKLKWRPFSLSDRGFTSIFLRSDWMLKAELRFIGFPLCLCACMYYCPCQPSRSFLERQSLHFLPVWTVRGELITVIRWQ